MNGGTFVEHIGRPQMQFGSMEGPLSVWQQLCETSRHHHRQKGSEDSTTQQLTVPGLRCIGPKPCPPNHRGNHPTAE